MTNMQGPLAVGALAVMLFCGGCSTLGDARTARGSGTTRTYPVSPESVWAVLPLVLNNLDLSIAGDYRADGYILAERGATMTSWGERVAVFVEPVPPSGSAVEVVSKRAVSVNVTAADWEPRVHRGLADALGLAD